MKRLSIGVMVFIATTFCGGSLPSLGGAESDAPQILFMIGEQEYRTEESLPEFAKSELEPHGFRTTFVRADTNDSNHFPGLEALKDADLLFLSVRRRTLTAEQMHLIRAHLDAGKGLIGIRTSSHAFALRQGQPPADHVVWQEFDSEVLGHNYLNHYNNREGTEIASVPHSNHDPLMTGITASSFHSSGTLYIARDIAPNATVLMRGSTIVKGEPKLEPVTWYQTHKNARVFYTSLGHIDDFKHPSFRRLLFNAVHWTLKKPIPDKAKEGALNVPDSRDKYKEGVAGNEQVEKIIKNRRGLGEIGDYSEPTEPQETLGLFQVHGDFEIELVASEPNIQQPLFMTWDHRGRLWIVQYLQFQFPAGLRVLRYDQYLRAVFDKVPPPPPNQFPGLDKVSVLEDTDRDGIFEKVKDVITGLNITSSVAIGRGGIWVLNPPYLLFYADADGNDVPDGDPEVHLSGFGLEDTHSIANSLRWGPDGWLYAANGSTTTATVNSAATQNLHYKGQCIWRYHPGTKVFEVFAEGGGNTFSVEIDSVGRVYSGTNSGRTRGMHYVQGGYGQKNWGKHGPLSNPFAFGFYEHMRHEGFPERFSQAFMLYEGGAFPEKYDHAVIAANSLHNRVVASELMPDTSSWRTVDLHPLVLSSDRWFRPVDIKGGPDGAVYLADWYDTRLSHNDPRDNWHKSSGRIYRLKAKDAKPVQSFDLEKLSSNELADIILTHKNKWFRNEALRVVADRKDSSIIPRLLKTIREDSSDRDLDALWALNLCGGFTEDVAMQTLKSKNPHVRRWTVRLLGDSRNISPVVSTALKNLATVEPDVEVRSQLASSAKRFSARNGLPIARELLIRSSDLEDLHIPLLLWWAIESKTVSDRQEVIAMFRDSELWQSPMVENHVLERLMQRYAITGKPEDLQTCAELVTLSPGPEQTRRLIEGLKQAFQGREIKVLPPALSHALDEYQRSFGDSDLSLSLRRGDREALRRALNIVTDSRANIAERLTYIEIMGQTRRPDCLDTLKKLLRTTGANAINLATLQALMNYDDPSIAQAILSAYHTTLLEEQGVRATANRILASRKEWALPFLKEIDKWYIKADSVSMDVVRQMALHDDEQIHRLIERLWGSISEATAEEKQKQISKLETLIKSGHEQPDYAQGKQLFTLLCAQCHTLFDAGGSIGPELTGYERDNLDFMLLSIVDPNAAIHEEYTGFVVETKDGRTLRGMIENQDTQTITLRSVDDQSTLLHRDQIDQLEASPISLMPEGLTEGLKDQQVRDLFAYLTSRTPR